MESSYSSRPGRRGRGFFRKLAVTMACAFAAGTVILSVPVTAKLMFDTLQIYPALPVASLAAEASGPPAAIVILSSGRNYPAYEYGEEFDHQVLDESSLIRVRYGAFVAHKTGLPVLVTGGFPIETHTLGDLMVQTLTADYGVQPKWIEDKSTTTAENAIFSAAILKQAGVNHIILVTEAWHMKRSVAAFTANGVSVTAGPTAFYFPLRESTLDNVTPGFGTLRMSGLALHEIVGSLWYRWKYGY